MLARLGRSAADRERALEATRRFAADAGHELRTPLTSVQATLSTLGRHPDLGARAPRGDDRDALAEQRRLVDLLDGLQALARGDAGPAGAHRGRPRRGRRRRASPPRASATPALRSARSCPTTPVADARAGSPGCACSSTTWSTTRCATAAPGGEVQVDAASAPATAAARCCTSTTTAPGMPSADARAHLRAVRARRRPPTARARASGLALVAQQARHHGARSTSATAALGGARFTVRFAASAH